MCGMEKKTGRCRLDCALAALAEGDAARHAALLRLSDRTRAVRRQIALERRRPGDAEALGEAFARGYADGRAGRRPRLGVHPAMVREAAALGYVAGELDALEAARIIQSRASVFGIISQTIS